MSTEINQEIQQSQAKDNIFLLLSVAFIVTSLLLDYFLLSPKFSSVPFGMIGLAVFTIPPFSYFISLVVVLFGLIAAKLEYSNNKIFFSVMITIMIAVQLLITFV